MVALNAIIDEYTLRVKTEGVDAAASGAQKLAAGNEAIAVSSEKVERKTLSVEGALNRFAAANDRAFKMQQALTRGQALLDRAFAQGLGETEAFRRAVAGLEAQQFRLVAANAQVANSNDKVASGFQRLSAAGREQAQALAVQDRLKAQFQAFSAQGTAQARAIGIVEAAQASNTKATALHAQAWTNLGFQVNDVVTSLASGISPMQTLAQQGGQIYQVLSGARGGVGGALSEIKGYLTGLITPARLVVGGLAAIGLTAVAAAFSWKSTENDVRQALSGVGRAAGATASDIEGIAVATAAASRTSVSAARDLTLELAKTGKIARENLQPIATIGKDFAKTIGGDAAEAQQLLAKTFADPGRGAEDLARRYFLLDDATMRYVQRLEAQNERTKAQQVLLDAIRPKLGNATELTTAWSYAWQKVKDAASGAYEAIGKAVDRALGGAGGRSDEDLIAGLRTRVDQLRARRATASDFDIPGIDRQLGLIERKLDEAEQRAGKARASAEDAQRIDLSLRAGLIARATVPELQALDELIDKRKELNDQIVNQGQGPGTREQSIAIARLDAQIRDYTEAGGALELQEKRNAVATQLRLDALKALTPEEVGAIASRRSLNDALGSAALGHEREAAAERARTEAVADARKQIDDQSRALDRSTESSNRVAEAWRISGEAEAMRGEAARKAAEDVARGLPADEEAGRRTRYLRQQIAELTQQRAQATAQMNAETAVEEKLNRAVDEGRLTREQADAQKQRDLQVSQLQIAASVAEGEAQTALLRQIDDLTAAWGRQNTAKTDAVAQNMIAEQDRTLTQLQTEANLLSKTTAERERALAVLRAQQDLQRQNIPLSSEKGRAYIDNAGLISDITSAKQQYERLAQDIAGIVSGIFDDLFAKTSKNSDDLINNITRGFSRFGSRVIEQNFISPLLGKVTTGSFDTNFDFDGMKKAVQRGFEGGFDLKFGPLLEPQKNPEGKSMGFASSPLGGALISGAAGYGIGTQTQSPLLGAVGGGLAGYATAGPIGAVIGAGSGLIGGILGGRDARKKAREARIAEWQQNVEAYQQAQPQIRQLERTFRGEATGGIRGQVEEATQRTEEAAKLAEKALDTAGAARIRAGLQTYIGRLKKQFADDFGGLLADLDVGLGLDGPFGRASAQVRTLGESLKSFVQDVSDMPGATQAAASGTARAQQDMIDKAVAMGGQANEAMREQIAKMFGGAQMAVATGERDARVARARAAAQEAALASLAAPKELSSVQERLREISGTASGLVSVLTDLGMSADQTAAVIAERTVRAIDQLRDSFSADLDRKINEATDRGYVNEIGDLLKERQTLLADAASLGTDSTRVETYFAASAQKIIDESALTGDAFAALTAQFPDLIGRVHEFSVALDTAAARAAAAQRALGYQDRLFAATNDTSTLAGQLAAYDRQAAREREEEVKAGGQALLDLVAAQTAERLKIEREYYEQVAEAQAQAKEQAKRAYDAFVRDIRQFLDGLLSGPSSPLSPQDRLAAARSQYDAQLALARSGDRDALDGITGYASDLLDAAKGFYASSAAFGTIFDQVTGQLGALPDQVSPDQFIVDAIETMRETLRAAIQANSPTAIASALNANFTKLDTSVNGLLDYSEFLAGVGPLATKAEQDAAEALFRSIDENGDGMLSSMEVLRNTLKAAIETNSPTAIANALNGNFAKLDTSVNGLLDYGELLTGLGPLASRAEQEAAKVIFRSIDADGDGQISKLELIRAQAGLTATNTADTTAAVAAGNAVLEQQKLVLDAVSSFTSATKDAVAAGNSIASATKDLTGGISAYTAATRDNIASGNNILTAINGLSGIQKSQLELLNKQFSLANPVTYYGNTLNNNMIEALNKIVFNTGQTVIAIKSDGRYGDIMLSSGGWVSGPGTGTSDSVPARLSNGEFVVNAAMAQRFGSALEGINAGRMPVLPMPMPVMVGNDNVGMAAMAAEIRALRAEVAALRGAVREGNDVAEQGHLGTIGAVKQNTAAVMDGNREASRQGIRRRVA